MPASSALSTGSLKALLSVTASAIPSALAEIAELVAFTISPVIESFEPVHWKSQLSRAQASWAPYCVGVKKGLVVTWLTNTNFHFGVEGKSPAPAAADEDDFLSLEVQAASSADAASEALAMPVPLNSRRRVTAPSESVSSASSTLGSSAVMGWNLLAWCRSKGWPRSPRPATGAAGSVGRELVDRGGLVELAGREHGRREVRVVGRVRVVLGLEGEAVALPVHPSAGPHQRPVQEVARVELQARLVGDDLEDAAAARLDHPRGQLQAAAVAVEHPVVVVAAADHELRVAVADARADGGRVPEVEGGAPEVGDLAGRDQRRVDRGVVAGVDPQLVAVDVAGALAGQVPVVVVGEVDDRLEVAVADEVRTVVHADLVLVGQRVGDLARQGARVALVAVGAGEGEHQGDAVVVLLGGRGPDVLVEADGAAVEAIGRVVDRQLVGGAVEAELAERDAVGIAAGDAAEVRALGDVVGEVVEAERDVGEAVVTVGDPDRLEDPAVGEDLHLHAVRVGQGVHVNLGAVGQRAEGRLGDARPRSVRFRGAHTDETEQREREHGHRQAAARDPAHGYLPLSMPDRLLTELQAGSR